MVIGAGPAGLAAANAADGCGARVTLCDDNPAPGGQIWRGRSQLNPAPGVTVRCGKAIALAPHVGKLILATGARERHLPFPGWTLPGVIGAGGLQAFVKNGLDVSGLRVVVAGSGPLLVAVAALLAEHGARIVRLTEQAPMRSAASIAMRKPWQAVKLLWQLLGVPIAHGVWPVRAGGEEKLEWVEFSDGRREECDWLACGWGLVPNTELASLCGCKVSRGAVVVDEFQRTSQRDVWAAGEVTGVGGVDKALVEGRIAGLAAAGGLEEARSLLTRRDKWREFTRRLADAYALREELRTLALPGTILCRCEDVYMCALEGHDSWRSLKLQTRCGMGTCQGRVCGPAVEFLKGWGAASIRPPIFPVSVEDLLVD